MIPYLVPYLVAYDPAFAYEIEIIIQDGIRRMYVEQEDVFYYLTVENENYPMPAMPEGVEEGILKGMYRFSTTTKKRSKLRAQLFGSGAIMRCAMEAQQILEEKYNVATDVWSITSFKNLHNDGLDVDRWNRLHPGDPKRVPYVTQCLQDEKGVFLVASDYVKAMPESISRWFPKVPVALGTDGFGRSEGRKELRRFFEVDAAAIVTGTLSALADEGLIEPQVVADAIADFGIDPDTANPVTR